MTAQVIFLNTMYFPDMEEMKRLDAIQEKLELAHAELAYATRNYSSFDKYLSKQRYHNGFRSKWRIYPGFKVNFTKLIEFNPKS
jgi:hypothetical protein